jgi:hypothetical protein
MRPSELDPRFPRAAPATAAPGDNQPGSLRTPTAWAFPIVAVDLDRGEDPAGASRQSIPRLGRTLGGTRDEGVTTWILGEAKLSAWPEENSTDSCTCRVLMNEPVMCSS